MIRHGRNKLVSLRFLARIAGERLTIYLKVHYYNCELIEESPCHNIPDKKSATK